MIATRHHETDTTVGLGLGTATITSDFHWAYVDQQFVGDKAPRAVSPLARIASSAHHLRSARHVNSCALFHQNGPVHSHWLASNTVHAMHYGRRKCKIDTTL